MLKGNLCERCNGRVQTAKAKHKQTKYCVECARAKKRENSLDPWPPDKRREYMREYMRGYRVETRLSCLVFLLPFLGQLPAFPQLSFEEIATGFVYTELLVIKVTGLVTVIVFCVRHLKHSLKGGDKEKKDGGKEA